MLTGVILMGRGPHSSLAAFSLPSYLALPAVMLSRPRLLSCPHHPSPLLSGRPIVCKALPRFLLRPASAHALGLGQLSPTLRQPPILVQNTWSCPGQTPNSVGMGTVLLYFCPRPSRECGTESCQEVSAPQVNLSLHIDYELFAHALRGSLFLFNK